MKLLKSIATLSGFTILSRIFGLVRDVLIAAVLGKTDVADAFFIAFRLPNFFRRLFADGAFNAAFVPTYTNLEHKSGRAVAVEGAENIKSILIMIVGCLVFFVHIFIPQLMYFIVPGFAATPDKFNLTVELTRITFPSIFFMSLAALYTGILNAYNRFVAGIIAPILLNIFMILAISIFKDTLRTPMHSLGWSILLATVCQFLWVKLATEHYGIKLHFRMPRMTNSARQMLRLIGPAAIAASMIQINMLISGIFLSFMLPGAISAFSYADRLNQFPLSLVGVAISTALLPTLSKEFQLQNFPKAVEIQNRVLELSYILILPASAGLYVLSTEIIEAVYGRGSFTHADVIDTGRVLAAFTLGLPAYVMVKIFSTAFFARHNTRIPLHATVAAVIANILLNFALVIPFGFLGIALATSIASWINAMWLLAKLKQFRLFTPDKRLILNTIKSIIASIIMGVLIYWLAKAYMEILFSTSALKFFVLGLVILAGIIFYFILLVLSRCINIAEIVGPFREK